MTLADRIVVLRAGIIEQQGTPLEIYNKPANRFVAGFIGSPKMNFLDVTAQNRRDDGLAVGLAGRTVVVPTDGDAARGAKLSLGLRPEHIELGAKSGLGLGDFAIVHVEQLGGQTIAYGRLADKQSLTIALDGQRKICAGDVLNLSIAADNCHLFDQTGARVGN
jgi:multiple sugar transport system ATP-binding protein